MKRSGGLLLLAALVVVGAFETAFHWLLVRDSFAPLLGVYLSPDAGGKYFYAGIVDSIAPAAILGCVNGWLGYPRWSIGRLCASAIAIAVFVAEMTRVYASIVGPTRSALVYGSPSGAPENVLFRGLSAFFITGVFTYGAYGFRREWKPRRSTGGALRPLDR
jgi:hypothetical protein